MDGVPSHWNNYLRVENVDESARSAEAAGGKVLVPGTDIPPGRFCVVASPSGATFSLFREADESARAVRALERERVTQHEQARAAQLQEEAEAERAKLALAAEAEREREDRRRSAAEQARPDRERRAELERQEATART